MAAPLLEVQELRLKQGIILTAVLLAFLSGGFISHVHATPDAFVCTETTISVLTPDTDQLYPVIWEDRVVYLDARNGTNDITLYHVLTGEEIKINGPFQSRVGIPPSISSELVVWESLDDSSVIICLSNITSSTQSILARLSQSGGGKPVIYGKHVIFTDSSENNLDLFMMDLDSGDTLVIVNINVTIDDIEPDMYENWIIWQGNENIEGDSDIYLKNLEIPDVIPLTPDTPEILQESPDIDKNYAVWQGYDCNNLSYDIYLYNLSSGQTISLTPDTLFTDEIHPSISGNRVVWEQMNETTSVSEIVLYSISSGETVILTPGDHGDQTMPSIYGDRIVWQEKNPITGKSDIRMATCGIQAPLLVPSFETNITGGEVPLEVQFHDISTGNPTGWWWDFGDGDTSYEQHPAHTYAQPGTNSVTLIANTQYRREGIVMENLIAAGSPPVPDFQADPIKGIVPLSVQFSDLSSASIVNWSWDFGDGTTSSEPNPLHRYTLPGLYNVTLTAGNEFGSETVEKPEFIAVMQGQAWDMTFQIEGVTLDEGEGTPSVTLNTTLLHGSLTENGTIYVFPPVPGHNISSLEIYSPSGFSYVPGSQDIMKGLVSAVYVESPEFRDPSATESWTVSSVTDMEKYPVEGRICVTAWPGVTPADYQAFRKIAMQGNPSEPNWTTNVYNDVEGVAFTAQFECDNITGFPRTELIFAIDSDWIQEYGWRKRVVAESDQEDTKIYLDGDFLGFAPVELPSNLSAGDHKITGTKNGFKDNVSVITLGDKRDSIRVIRVAEDGSGEILTTEFLYHDPETNLDYFRAESPHGFSTFGVVTVSKAGNPIQILFLLLQELFNKLPGGRGHSSLPSPGEPAPSPTTIPTKTGVPTEIHTITNTVSPTSTHISELTGVPTTGSGTGETPAITPTSPKKDEVPPPIPPTLIQTIAIVSGVIIVVSVLLLRWQKGGEQF